MYYNEITKNFTKSEFRIKTEEELISDYDEDWREVGELDWVMGMDKYLGQDEDECYEYHVSDYCVTLNKHIDIDYNKPKKLVYEKSNFIGLDNKTCIFYKCESPKKVDELKEFLKDKVNADISENYDDYILINNVISVSFKISIPEQLEHIVNLWKEDGYEILMYKTIEEVKRVFIFDSKDSYNKPKQLVYEKLGEKILIIYKSESVEKVDELKEYLEDKIKQDFSNHWDEYICITSTLAYSFNLSEPNSGDVERSWGELGYTIVKCSTLEEVKNKIEFKFDSKSVYNKPKQLVYEKLENTNYAIIYVCGTIEDTIKLIKYLRNRGYSTEQLDENLVSDYYFIIIKKDGVSGRPNIYPIKNPSASLDRITSSLEKDNFGVYECFYLDDVMEMMNAQLFIDYNKPKQLVYEKLEEKYAIVYKCGSNENTIKLINYLDIRGFNTEDLDKSLSSNYDFIIIRSSGVGSGNTIIYPIINPRMGLDFVIVSLERNDFVVYDPDNLKSLMELMGGEIFVDYNKPKQLVYEKKILSFKKFNDK